MKSSVIFKYNGFKKLVFPPSPANERLEDVFIDLVQYDSLIAGEIDKLIKGKLIKSSDFFYSNVIEEKLNRLLLQMNNTEDVHIIQLYLQYLKNIEELINSVKINLTQYGENLKL